MQVSIQHFFFKEYLEFGICNVFKIRLCVDLDNVGFTQNNNKSYAKSKIVLVDDEKS